MLEDLAPILMFAVFTLIFIIVIIKTTVDNIRNNRRIQKEWEQPFEEIPHQAVNARVLDKRTDMLHGRSYRFPEHKIVYFVTFLTDYGKTVEYQVPAECYGRVNIHQTGMLITVGDEFFDFGDGEDIEQDSQ
ncbi:MAG: DUF2500 family protein [Clostridia bacterium]|nr:DUF2500 family protein [Clostridia bacterium]